MTLKEKEEVVQSFIDMMQDCSNTDLEIEKQQQQVKRNKDRIKKVLERKLKGKQY